MSCNACCLRMMLPRNANASLILQVIFAWFFFSSLNLFLHLDWCVLQWLHFHIFWRWTFDTSTGVIWQCCLDHLWVAPDITLGSRKDNFSPPPTKEPLFAFHPAWTDPRQHTELCYNHLKHFFGLLSITFSQCMNSCKEIISGVLSAFCKNQTKHHFKKEKLGTNLAAQARGAKYQHHPSATHLPHSGLLWQSNEYLKYQIEFKFRVEKECSPPPVMWRTFVSACTFNFLQWSWLLDWW